MICIRCGKEFSIAANTGVCESCGFDHGNELGFIFSLTSFERELIEHEQNASNIAAQTKPEAAKPVEDIESQEQEIQYGTLNYSNGDKYTGELLDGKKHGRGTYTWSNDSKYEGDWSNDKIQGYGIFTWSDGSKYEGDFLNEKRHGQGMYTSVKGDIYEGEYKDDKKHGRGTYAWVDGNEYEGDWSNGKIQGYGIFTWSNGSKYEGDFLNDKRHGQGMYTDTDGCTWNGVWQNGMLDNDLVVIPKRVGSTIVPPPLSDLGNAPEPAGPQAATTTILRETNRVESRRDTPLAILISVLLLLFATYLSIASIYLWNIVGELSYYYELFLSLDGIIYFVTEVTFLVFAILVTNTITFRTNGKVSKMGEYLVTITAAMFAVSIFFSNTAFTINWANVTGFLIFLVSAIVLTDRPVFVMLNRLDNSMLIIAITSALILSEAGLLWIVINNLDLSYYYVYEIFDSVTGRYYFIGLLLNALMMLSIGYAIYTREKRSKYTIGFYMEYTAIVLFILSLLFPEEYLYSLDTWKWYAVVIPIFAVSGIISAIVSYKGRKRIFGNEAG